MRKHIFQTDVNTLISSGKAFIKASEDMVLAYRVSMVLLVLQGMSALQIAECAGLDPRTIQLWVDTADKKGFEALKPKRSNSGRHKILDDKQKAIVKAAVAADPSIEGYNVWDGIALSDFILKKFNIKASVRTCQRLFHELGFSTKMPQTHPYHGSDEEAHETFKKN